MILLPSSPAGLARVAAALLPWPGLLAAPAQAEDGRSIAICSGAGVRLIYLPAGTDPAAPGDERKSHFTCCACGSGGRRHAGLGA